MSAVQNVIEMSGITKEFGTFRANDNINLDLKRGEIHALLGENGAGKSTLMNILSGLLEPTSGEIKVKGNLVKITSPDVANELGIGMVHQHFMLVDKFTVTENIMLGREKSKFGYIDKKSAEKEIRELSDQYGLKVDPSAKVENITVGMQQRVEILKTLYRGADILIFDEPTGVLTPQEIEELMGIMRKLTAEGKSIILITHKLDEIKQVSNRCTVIRRGKSVDTVDVSTTTQQELADMMVGRSVTFKVDKKPADPKGTVLKVDQLTVKESRGYDAVKEISFEVKAGEILGIAGVDGNGQSELIQALSGLTKSSSGKVHLAGTDITNKKPRKITEAGLGHIPEDRQKYGLILPMTLEENISLQTYYQKPYSNHGFLNYKEIKVHAKRLIEEFDVRTPSEEHTAASLSGGNQQKAIIAREIDRDPSLLIAAQPTRGLDVGAIEYIHKRLIELRDNGKAVLLMSYELDEVMNVSDRIAVMYDGKIISIVKANETNESELGLLMAGVPLAEAKKQVNEDGKEKVTVDSKS
ncbi:ABC transporter ATP-binding protein [Marinilactibacillus psychrotolerans]|uniref:ABC transporter ATP-binding protein n=3 Tax=Marinilactibacillus psychrotolerans TaxID=191770 RepID=A0ABW8UL88_9LACT|nr:ABC transporter ATP-binding protein [Marinilactibacillus psychrotolerans]GEQ32122.1 heme ABC transporter ATP-binding protein [Marinilactibacillus psychrotolerans]SJN18572.1 Unspecified monosaccharide ABC transport system, ATP-binding protein [Marinilactibacillus psychrotolerans 42ea]